MHIDVQTVLVMMISLTTNNMVFNTHNELLIVRHNMNATTIFSMLIDESSVLIDKDYSCFSEFWEKSAVSNDIDKYPKTMHGRGDSPF